jgi:hypothetical protein
MTKQPKIGVIINEGKELGDGLEMLRAILAEHGHADPPWIEVPKSKKAPEQIRHLVDEGVYRLLVWAATARFVGRSTRFSATISVTWRSGSSPPGPATCSPPTSVSRSNCGQPPRSPSVAKPDRSTWAS